MLPMRTAGDFSIGIEEEYQLVDPESRELRPGAPSVIPRAEEATGESFKSELHEAQIEMGTRICRNLDDIRQEVVRLRREVIEAAAGKGLSVAAAGTHPFSRWEDQTITQHDRYLMLEEQYQHVARETVTFGSHVHVGIGDDETAIQLMNRCRRWIPPLLALAANSPFWQGVDTGYASFRTEIARRWPLSDVPQYFLSRAHYEDLVRDLVATRSIEDASQIYWDLRPSDNYDTLEFRTTDVCLSVDETVMITGLTRALARRGCAEIEAGVQSSEVRPELMLAAKWRASRFGLDEELIDLENRRSAPAREVVGELLGFVRPALEEAGEWEEISGLVEQTLGRGTGAARQRRAYERAGRLEDVVDLVLTETAAGVT